MQKQNQPTRADAAVRVYLRIRPLIPEEDGHDVIDYQIDDGDASSASRPRGATFRLTLPDRGSRPRPNSAFAASAPPFLHRRATVRSFGGFANVLGEGDDNAVAYRTAVRPLIEPVASSSGNGSGSGSGSGSGGKRRGGESACVFTYGHTGSGKTHTLLGYGDERGMYERAAEDLLEQIQARDPAACLLVRVTELYKDQVVDLLTGEPCSVRQDGRGRVQIRGPMVEDEVGRIEQRPLGVLCRTAQEVATHVGAACEGRRVGSSTHHDKSSRSHLVLELEVVTPDLVEKRNELARLDAQVTRLKWLQTERGFNKHADRPMPKWTEEYPPSTVLRREIQRTEGRAERSREDLRRASEGRGGTLVFCDLAGNEYARDGGTSTDAERGEAAEINRSLLAVKEMVRSLGRRERERRRQDPNGRKGANAKGKRHHVPYRDSKLTMCLKRHLETRAVMLAHISPSVASLKKTINTLNYGSMAGGVGGVASGGGEKENNR